jgi:hypothetical protein
MQGRKDRRLVFKGLDQARELLSSDSIGIIYNKQDRFLKELGSDRSQWDHEIQPYRFKTATIANAAQE